MGLKTVKAFRAKNVYSHAEIYGMNFTEHSKVIVNGETLETIYNGPSELWVNNYKLKDGDRIFIAQTTENGNILGTSAEFIYHDSKKKSDDGN